MGKERRVCAMNIVGTLSNTCPKWGIGEERRISAIYTVGGVQTCLQWEMGEKRICISETVRCRKMILGRDIGGGWGCNVMV